MLRRSRAASRGSAAALAPTSRHAFSLRARVSGRGGTSVGSSVDAYGVDSELDGVKLMVEKNTGFALPMKATDPKADLRQKSSL